MPLNKNEVRQLIDWLQKTKSDEIDCDECLMRVSEFAETRLAGKPTGEWLKAVEQHLSVCPECMEEFEMLSRVLKTMGPADPRLGVGFE